MTLPICSWVSRSLNDGMICEKARAGPPLVIMARHWMSGSGGRGRAIGEIRERGRRLEAREACDVPVPSGPWQETHPAL